MNGANDSAKSAGARKAWVTRRRKTKRRRSHSGKGELIKGMSRRLPSEILESLLFRHRLRTIMRGYAGIYALYRGKRLYYVGLTKNLLGRLKWHLRDRHKGKWTHFIIFRIHKVRYLKDIETLIHNLISLPGNRVQGRVPRDADINRALREVLREHEVTIRGIRRALR
jgi:hypothetical protein